MGKLCLAEARSTVPARLRREVESHLKPTQEHTDIGLDKRLLSWLISQVTNQLAIDPSKRKGVRVDESRPIFIQIAEQIENDILSEALPEGTQVPSTNAYAAFHRINPATAGKGVNLLVDRGVLYKKRGIGMFVAEGSRSRIIAERRGTFLAEFVRPLVDEAHNLGITSEQLATMIMKEGKQ